MSGIERKITQLAESQHGLISRAQALELGLSAEAIQRRLSCGRWTAIHEGVYRVGGSVASLAQSRLAAVLAVGPVAAVSHRAAADVWGLWWSNPPMIEITTTRDQSPELDGVAVHRMADLHPRWITAVDGMPVTTVARTLVDLGAVMPAKRVAMCVDRALGRALVSATEIETARRAVARQGRRGAGVIRRVLAPRLGREPVAGVFEARMARLLSDQGLPEAVPEYEVRTALGTFVARVDFAYPELKLAIEVDGLEAHSSIDAFRHDRARQNALVAEGWTVLRFTWTEVDRGSAAVGHTIRAARHRLVA
jgi:predicted transcriptional regulator of viral defense system